MRENRFSDSNVIHFVHKPVTVRDTLPVLVHVKVNFINNRFSP